MDKNNLIEVTLLANAIRDALKADDPTGYVASGDIFSEKIIIDGSFNLSRVAHFALAALASHRGKSSTLPPSAPY